MPRMSPGPWPPANPEPYKDPGKATCGLCGKVKTSLHTSRGFIRTCTICDSTLRWPQR